MTVGHHGGDEFTRTIERDFRTWESLCSVGLGWGNSDASCHGRQQEAQNACDKTPRDFGKPAQCWGSPIKPLQKLNLWRILPGGGADVSRHQMIVCQIFTIRASVGFHVGRHVSNAVKPRVPRLLMVPTERVSRLVSPRVAPCLPAVCETRNVNRSSGSEQTFADWHAIACPTGPVRCRWSAGACCPARAGR